MTGSAGTYADWDWLVTRTGFLLHAPGPSWTHEMDADTYAKARTLCGMRGWLEIPGLAERMSTPRCTRCCHMLGYPDGVGSPKNDARCRAILKRRLEQSA